jgi:hypothetical protein
MKPHTLDPIVKFPDHSDAHGRAWRVDVPALRVTKQCPADRDATLDLWIIEAPWAHPIWHSYLITLVHLRPMPGFDVHFYRSGASHEFQLFALDPAKPRAPAVSGQVLPGVLTPANFAAQLVEESDEGARATIRKAVTQICAAQLSPDTDFLGQWVARFGGQMLKGWHDSEGAPLQ